MRDMNMERSRRDRGRSPVRGLSLSQSRREESKPFPRPPKSAVKRPHPKEPADFQRHSRNDKERRQAPSSQEAKRHVIDAHSKKKHQSRDHRNSSTHMVHSNRNIDNNISSDESDSENRHHKRSRRIQEESFEELSRRKRLIESELHALDAEERATTSKGERRPNRDRADHRPSASHYTEKPVRVKQEPPDNGYERNSKPNRARRSADSRQRRNGERHSHSPQGAEWGKREQAGPAKPEKDKEKPNFQTSGKLAEDTNTYNGVVIKYNEPREARKPRRKWRLYPFKGDTSLPFVPVHRQSAYLLGRSRLIADIPIDHPSCSKQHAVLQFRMLPYERPDGTTGRSVRPYIIDLDSSNGTYVNNNKVEPRRYVELLEKDVLKFGFSTRVYVILHEDSKKANEDDEVENSS